MWVPRRVQPPEKWIVGRPSAASFSGPRALCYANFHGGNMFVLGRVSIPSLTFCGQIILEPFCTNLPVSKNTHRDSQPTCFFVRATFSSEPSSKDWIKLSRSLGGFINHQNWWMGAGWENDLQINIFQNPGMTFHYIDWFYWDPYNGLILIIPTQLGSIVPYTPPKINIEPENDGLEDDVPFPVVYSQDPC